LDESQIAALRDRELRLHLSQLALSVVELVALVGQLNALVGMETDANLDRHKAIKEGLFDIAATATRASDYFAPPSPRA
jgi:hypothetical protein